MESLAPNCGVTPELGHFDLIHGFYGPKFILTYCKLMQRRVLGRRHNMLAASQPAVGMVHSWQLDVCVCLLCVTGTYQRFLVSGLGVHT